MNTARTTTPRRFLHERFTVSDLGRPEDKKFALVVWSPQVGMMDAVALDARLRRRFVYLAAKELRTEPLLRPDVDQIELEQVGARVKAWVFGSVELLAPWSQTDSRTFADMASFAAMTQDL